MSVMSWKMVKSDTNDKPQASSHCTSMGCTNLIHSYTLQQCCGLNHSFLIGDTCDPAWAHFSKVLKLFGRIAGDMILFVSSK